jgi:hypothetical protein
LGKPALSTRKNKNPIVKKTKASTLYYNPNLKPTSYQPGKPTWYWGLPNDLGFTYSQVNCLGCGSDSTLLKASSHCPYCGDTELAEMEGNQPSAQEINQSLTNAPYATLHEDCSSCGQSLTTSCADLSGIEEIHCPNCGNLMSEFYESLNAMLNQKGSKMAKSKAALQKVIADLKNRGEKVLAMELEKEMKSMDDEGEEGKEPIKAGQDSGVDQVAFSGDKEDDAATMMEQEAANPKPVVEEQDAELTLAISQVEKLLKHGVQATIIKTKTGYTVKATDELEDGEVPLEEKADEQPDIVDEATAQMIIRANLRKGKKTRITRVESGFVLTAMEEEKPVEEKLADSPIPDQKTTLPEDKAAPTTAVKLEEKAAPAIPDQKTTLPEEKAADNIIPEEKVEGAVKALQALGKNAKITRVSTNGYIVKAEDEKVEEKAASPIPGQETVMPEEKAGPVAAAEADPEVLPEEKVESAIAALHKAGKNARVTKVLNGFVVMAEDDGGEAIDEKIAHPEDGDAQPEVMSEDEAEKAIAALNKAGKNAKVTRVVNGFVVKADGEELNDKVDEIKQDASDDSKEVLEDLVPPSELKAEEKKDEIQSFDDAIDEQKAASEEDHAPMSADDAEKAVAAFHKVGKNAKVTCVGANLYVVSAEGEEMVEEKPVEEEKADEQPGMEPLAPADEMKADGEEDVVMLSQADVNGVPFYNVIVKGMPVARINLIDQPNHAKIADYFPTENYAMDLVDAMLKFGVEKTLRKVNAKFYANEIVNKNLVEKVSAKQLDEYNRKYASAVATVRDDLADRLAMVIAASNKNFWNTETHHLKVALFDSVEAALKSQNLKLSDEAIAEAIETGFESGAAPFFGAALDKALGFLDMPKEALASLKTAIGEANIQSLEYDGEDADEEQAEEALEPDMAEGSTKTMASWLATKNVPVSPTATEWKDPKELNQQFTK